MSWADPFSPSKVPLPVGDLDLTHGCLGPPSPHPKRHIDPFPPIVKGSQSLQIDRKADMTDPATGALDCGNMPHLAILLRRGLIMITSGQSNLTTGRIVAANRQFSSIRQVAPVCTLT